MVVKSGQLNDRLDIAHYTDMMTWKNGTVVDFSFGIDADWGSKSHPGSRWS